MSVATGLVSVIMPVYNGGTLLSLALQSISAQDYPHVEVIVINDGSDDDSAQVLETFAASCDRPITIVLHPDRQRHGIAASYQLGLQHCQGQYIAFLEQDDVWPTNKLSAQLSIFAAYPEVGVVFSEVYLCDESGRVAAQPYSSLLNKPPAERPFRAFWRLLWGNYLCTFSNFMVRAHWLHPDDIIAEPAGFQDWMLLLQLADRCQFYYCNTTKTFWRQRSASFSAQLRQLPTFRRMRKCAIRQAMHKVLSDRVGSKQPWHRSFYTLPYWSLVISLLSALERVAGGVRRQLSPPWASPGQDGVGHEEKLCVTCQAASCSPGAQDGSGGS